MSESSTSAEPKSSSAAAEETASASTAVENDKPAAAESEGGETAAGSSQEPKNVQELTNYIQSMLQQMQDRFQVSRRIPPQRVSRTDVSLYADHVRADHRAD